MTQEEAIALFEKQLTAAQVVLDSGFGSNPGENDFLYRRRKDMAEIALAALRPVSRERVEKLWRGEWQDTREAYNDVPKRRCSRCKSVFIGLDTPFCEVCGAPMTDEAVEMVMERLRVLTNDN